VHHNLAVIYDYYLNDQPMALHHYKKYMDLEPLQKESHKIRERMLDLELLSKVVPDYPLKLDFSEYHRQKS
jgi:hypothetical protein